MLIALDVGNTNIDAGFFQDNKLVFHTTIEGDYRDDEQLERTFRSNVGSYAQHYAQHNAPIEAVIFSTVVPYMIPKISEMCAHYVNSIPIHLNSGLFNKIGIDVPSPQQIGSDIVANALAAWHTLHDRALIVDFGTALTFTIVDAGPSILGVSIVPGIETAARSLATATAQLPQIDVSMPHGLLGRNTHESIKSGIVFGYASLVEGMVARFRSEYGNALKVIATGGGAILMSKMLSVFDIVNKNLTLEGIMWAYNDLKGT